MAARYSVRTHIEALNRHDAETFAGFYQPNAVVYDPQYPEPLKGRDAVRTDMADFLKAFPDLSFTVTNVVEGDGIVAFEGTGKGTHKGPLSGPGGEIAATNQPIELRFAGFVQFDREGRIVEERRYYDLAGLMQQLGIGV